MSIDAQDYTRQQKWRETVKILAGGTRIKLLFVAQRKAILVEESSLTAPPGQTEAGAPAEGKAVLAEPQDAGRAVAASSSRDRSR